jgi:hypothetical protein
MSKKFLSATVAAALLLFAQAEYAAADIAPQPTRVKIASINHHERGCSESSHTFVIDIPNAEHLDLDYKGPVAGLEFIEVEGNNGHSINNIAFVDGTKKVTVTLWAKGSGNRINNPFNGGSVCAGGAGGSQGVDIFAHFKK